MDEEKAMLQLTNINLQMAVAELTMKLITAGQTITRQAQRIHELEASYQSGIKIENGEFYV